MAKTARASKRPSRKPKPSGAAGSKGGPKVDPRSTKKKAGSAKPAAGRPDPARGPKKVAGREPEPKTKPVPGAAKPAPVKPEAPKAVAAPKPGKGVPEKVKGTPAPAPAAAAPVESEAAKKKAPKGITIVTPKPVRVSKPKVKFQLPVTEPLIKPGAKWKPLIASGPSAPPRGTLEEHTGGPGKSKLPKKELDRYKQVLLSKRAELVGDVRRMEDEALRQSGSGSLSALPQHMAEQGTDTFDQALSLDLAQVDRNLIREIDAALERIDAGTFGICERTGKPISAERLQELPWARYSIEAARELERRPYQT